MEKINLVCVLKDHLATLVDARTERISLWDVLVFFGIPLFLSAAGVLLDLKIADEIDSALIAVFAVFAALLFSAQIGIFGLYRKTEVTSEDEIAKAVAEHIQEDRRRFFYEVNANVSYLILLSVVSLLWFVVALYLSGSSSWEVAVTAFLASHFLLTILMVVKRVHVAFSASYLQN